jgi:hypothetical protein
LGRFTKLNVDLFLKKLYIILYCKCIWNMV